MHRANARNRERLVIGNADDRGVRGLVNRFGEQVVHDGVDLDVRRGEILGVVGGPAPASRC
jgi:ABC-type sugar transport system ATPase subunit